MRGFFEIHHVQSVFRIRKQVGDFGGLLSEDAEASQRCDIRAAGKKPQESPAVGSELRMRSHRPRMISSADTCDQGLASMFRDTPAVNPEQLSDEQSQLLLFFLLLVLFALLVGFLLLV